MTLHHFPHRAIDGAWHAVYRRPICGSLMSVVDCLTARAARSECRRLNGEQAAKHDASMVTAVHPADRRIPAGFYSDDDAA